jgi:hypothetical protein
MSKFDIFNINQEIIEKTLNRNIMNYNENINLNLQIEGDNCISISMPTN